MTHPIMYPKLLNPPRYPASDLSTQPPSIIGGTSGVYAHLVKQSPMAMRQKPEIVARKVPSFEAGIPRSLVRSGAYHSALPTTRQNLALLSRITTWAFVCIALLFAVLGLLALLGFFGLADAGFEEKLFIGGPSLLGSFCCGLGAVINFALGTELERREPDRCIRCENDLRGIEGICPECGHDQRESSPDAQAEN